MPSAAMKLRIHQHDTANRVYSGKYCLGLSRALWVYPAVTLGSGVCGRRLSLLLHRLCFFWVQSSWVPIAVSVQCLESDLNLVGVEWPRLQKAGHSSALVFLW